MDWANWHKLYDAGLGLSVRLRIVREQIQAALDECAPGPVRIVSICAGDGRDVIEAVSCHRRCHDVAATLIDNHAPSLDRGRALASEAGVAGQIEFVCADATLAGSYLGSVPADVIIISGVLGHVSDAWLPRFLGNLPMLCQEGGSVIWNRHQVVNRGAEHVRLIQQILRARDFHEVHFEATSPTGFAVSRARFRGTAQPLDPGRVLFEFAGLDRLVRENEATGETASAGDSGRAAGFPTGATGDGAKDVAEAGEKTSRMATAAVPDVPLAEETLPDCFERRAKQHPHRIALGSGAWQPSYGELQQTAEKLAALIQSRGGVVGDRVALLMQHDTPLIAAMLAVLKAGRVVVVLSPSDPPARLGQVLADAEPTLLLTDLAHRELADQLPDAARAILLFEEQVAAESPPFREEPVSPESPAFLIYTSGSTGPPKGVLQSHGNVVHKALRVSRSLELRADERIVLLGGLSGGQGVNTTLCALLNGATLCPFPIMNIGVTGLADWLVAHGITVFVSAASVFRHFVRTLGEDTRFPLTRLVWLASEPATSDDVKACRKHFADDCVLFHTLASSETGVIAHWRVNRMDRVPEGRLPVGRAADGIELLLFDERGREVPRGETGEIAIRSRHLSTGYWRNDALTVRRFSEVAGSGGVRVFRSGDRGRLNADGLLEFMGRQDTRVNVHGYRVELSEIEEALSRQPAVEKGVVGMHLKPSGDEQIAAYIMPRSGHTPSTGALRDALRVLLPGHMIPTAFVFLEHLPLTPHGKVDREALRLISPPAQEPSPGDEPVTVTEKILAGIWSSVFGCSQAGRQDHFFDLGGDSLTAAVMAAKIHEALHVQLDLRVFAEHPTLASLAAAVDLQVAARGPRAAPPLVRASRDEPFPLSFHQERVWKYSQTAEGSGGYGAAGRQLVRGPLDVELLRESLTYLASRHEILRTTVSTIDGRPVQVVHPPAPVPLPLIDLSGASDAEEQAARIFQEEAGRTVDLVQGPLLRFMLIRLRDQEHEFFRMGHHIMSDAWSWDIYFNELGLVYEAKLRGDKVPLPECEPLHYGDYAVWQRQVMRLDGSAYQEMSDWWKRSFSGAPPPLELRFRRPAPQADVDPDDGSLRMKFDPAISQRLRRVGRDANATFYAVRLAAYVALLADECGQGDVILGTYVTNRNRVETQKMFGFFANLVTMRFRCDATLTFRDWLARVGTIAGEFQAHGEIPYEQLCEELRKQGAGVPEIRAIFSSSNRGECIRFGGLELTKVVSRRTRMPWGFDLHFYQGAAGDECRVVFDAGIYDPAGVRTFVERLFRLLDEASRHPDSPLSTLLEASGARGLPVSLVPVTAGAGGTGGATEAGGSRPVPESGAGKRVAITNDFAAWSEGELEQSIGRRFEKQVAQYGDRTAVRGAGTRFTYEELDRAANRLAAALLAEASPPGARVVLIMQHDAPLIAAMLGVLKAGRICVPLSPAQPEARLALLLAQTDPGSIVSDARHLPLAARLAGNDRRLIHAGELEGRFPEARPGLDISPDALAFLIYTSGSIGQPKGVLQNHRNILHQVRGYTHGFHLNARDRICLLASCSGGQGLSTAFCALLNGATLSMRDLEKHGVADLGPWLAKERVTVFVSAVSLFRLFAKTLTGPRQFPDLRLVKLGAETVRPADVKRFRECFPPSCIFASALSCTETGNLTQFLIGPDCELPGDTVPAGYAVEGKDVYLTDESGNKVGAGGHGEIVVRSRYLSPGYWRDAGQTALAFRAVPGCDQRIYHTGDFGRMSPDGCLEHLGRKDGQVKVRGYRVNLAEIEAALLNIPGVRSAAVVTRNASGREMLLIACVEPANPDISAQDLRQELGRILPGPMVPHHFVCFAQWPVTANGKPDRQRLLAQLGSVPSANGVEPRSALEARVAAVWARVLQQDSAGVYDNFFEVGGDSLNAIDLVISLSEELGVKLPSSLLLHHPTIAQLAEAIESGFVSVFAEPWFRPWRASLLPLRESGSDAPVVFIPGGYGGENELLVCAGLLPHLDSGRPMFGVRLNLLARRVLRPWSLRGIARRIGRALLRQSPGRPPIIIGECHACALALETAQWLAGRLDTPPLLVLLDPWQPRTAPGETSPRNSAHPRAIERYFRFLRTYKPAPYRGEMHVICAGEDSRLEACLAWWKAGGASRCDGHRVPGDHDTYIRQHRKSLAAAINAILNRDRREGAAADEPPAK